MSEEEEMVTIGEIRLGAVAFVASQEGILPREFTDACKAVMAAHKSKYDRWREGISISKEMLHYKTSWGKDEADLMAASLQMLDAIVNSFAAWKGGRYQATLRDSEMDAIRSAVPADVAREVLGE